MDSFQTGTALVPRATIEDMVSARDRTLDLYARAYDAIEQAHAAIKTAADAGRSARANLENPYSYSDAEEIKRFNHAVVPPPRDEYLRVARKLTDNGVWAAIIQMTDLESLMDKTAKDELRDQMRYVPDKPSRRDEVITGNEAAKGLPQVTVDNIYATLERFRGDAGSIFRRGIATAFAKLDRRFKSHDGFKVGSRIILSYAFNDYGGWAYGRHHRDTLIDIERTFKILDGIPVSEGNYTSTIGAIDTQRQGYGAKQTEVETEYFKIRIFLNGNAHIWFKRKDLVERVNAILAEWYGEVIGDGMAKEDDPFANPKTLPAKRFGFYPTPPEAAARLLEHVPFYRDAGQPRARVLEPSAGSGNIARLCAARMVYRSSQWQKPVVEHDYTPIVDCVEVQPHLADDLRREGIYNRVTCADFLQLTPRPDYDIVVMNPPFDLERDIDHVFHVMKFLKPDGCLASIMSAGVEFRETKKARAFRDLVKGLNGRFEALPAGAFSTVGTNVNTVILRVRADGRPPRY